MTFEETTISSRMIYEGRILNLRLDQVTTINGESAREIVEHSGGVTIAAITDDNKMVMVKQYRKAAEKVVLEAPAGKLDGDEEPLAAARRELKEETGYEAGRIEKLTSFYASVGYSTERLHLFLATDLIQGEPAFDENEAIDIHEIDLGELKQAVMRGEIEDSKTIAAIMMAAVRQGV